MRSVAGYDLSSRIEYGKVSLARAADALIEKITNLGGDGGFIALDPKGHVAIRFNTEGMTRGYIDASGKPMVKIFKDE